MRSAKQIAAIAAHWSKALAQAAAEQKRKLETAARAFRAWVLRVYAALVEALSAFAVGVLEIGWGLRVLLYFLAIPILSSIAAICLARPWIWYLALLAWGVVVFLFFDMRRRLDASPSDVEVFSERVRSGLAKLFKAAIHGLVFLVSATSFAIFAFRVGIPWVKTELAEMRLRLAHGSPSPTHPTPSTPLSITPTAARPSPSASPSSPVGEQPSEAVPLPPAQPTSDLGADPDTASPPLQPTTPDWVELTPTIPPRATPPPEPTVRVIPPCESLLTGHHRFANTQSARTYTVLLYYRDGSDQRRVITVPPMESRWVYDFPVGRHRYIVTYRAQVPIVTFPRGAPTSEQDVTHEQGEVYIETCGTGKTEIR